jgi:hypothetical protein
LDQRVREKIQASMLIRALTDCVAGRNKMTSVQVRAAEVLLKKVVPDPHDQVLALCVGSLVDGMMADFHPFDMGFLAAPRRASSTS